MNKTLTVITTVIAIVILVAVVFLLFRQGTEGDQMEEIEGVNTANTVTIENYIYTPSTIRIKRGETVTWTNRDSVRHDVAGETFKGPLLRRGQSYSYTFNETGTFDYTCTPHPYMKGTVIVEE